MKLKRNREWQIKMGMNTKMKGRKDERALITNNCNIDACFKIQK